VKVVDVASSMEYHLGAGTGFQATRVLAAAETAGMIFTFDLAAPGEVRFFIKDGGGCGDNRSSVTVTLDDLSVPDKAQSWGALKSIYR